MFDPAEGLLGLEPGGIILLWNVYRAEEGTHSALNRPRQIPVPVLLPSSHTAALIELAVKRMNVTVEYQGRELTLSLAQPKIAAMSMTQTMSMPQPQMMGQPPIQPGSVTVSPADDRQRLEHIADEIRRRRAMRASMQQQQFPPGANLPPGYAPPQQQQPQD